MAGLWQGPTVVAIGAPAAGHDWTWQAPQNLAAKVLSIHARLTTHVTVATRKVTFLVKDADGNLLGKVRVPKAIVATKTAQVTAWSGATRTTATATDQLLSLGEVVLPEGASISSTTAGLAATDQWGEITLLVAYWDPTTPRTQG